MHHIIINMFFGHPLYFSLKMFTWMIVNNVPFGGITWDPRFIYSKVFNLSLTERNVRSVKDWKLSQFIIRYRKTEAIFWTTRQNIFFIQLNQFSIWIDLSYTKFAVKPWIEHFGASTDNLLIINNLSARTLWKV